jgi:phosphatidylinositol glycan class V
VFRSHAHVKPEAHQSTRGRSPSFTTHRTTSRGSVQLSELMAQSTPGDELQRKHLRVLLWASILSRTVTWILALAASHLPVFDSSPRILISERSLVDPLLRWDTFQFGPIALDGYVYEHNWAFFPGTPLVMRYSGLIVEFFRGTGKEATAVSWESMLFGSALAVLLTFGATSTLYRLSVYHLRTPQLAFVASLLSLIPTSPATLYLAPYAEPFFTYLSYKGSLPSSTTPLALTMFSGMLYCAQRMWFRATICFVLAACFRSNGLLLGGFLLWGVVVQPSLKQHHVRGGCPREIIILLIQTQVQFRALLQGIIFTLAVAAPSILHQYVAHRIFCRETTHPRPVWCKNSIPSVYNHVQSKYWNVGFLRYWTPSQIPNFFLAAPVLALLFSFSAYHLGSALPLMIEDASALLFGKPTPGRPRAASQTHTPFLNNSITPHAVHAAIIGAVLLFAAHVQIVLRFAVSLPLVSWAGAWLILEHPTWGRCWVTYIVLWGTASVVLWSAFLPPA